MASNINPDYTKERIRFLTEIFKLLFGFFILLSTGTIGLLLKQFIKSSPKEVIALFVGMVLMVLILLLLRGLYSSINSYINQLK